MSYGPIRYLIKKKLSTALYSKLNQGKPPKYCRMCQSELRKPMGRQLEKGSLEKKYMKGRCITEQKCDKRKINSCTKKNSQKRKCSPLSCVAATVRQSRKCYIVVRNIAKTVCLYVTTSIKAYNQGEAVHLPKRLQWVNISVPSLNDSLQDQTV